ncbi:DgyrCDS9961 [Dimorphilus gyrociliatus]|uniref:DgyrCDS9961 n=1 Tax=Dimorphilus gyrociliatus TaxID=2664684 RepID=A0A7I8W078_9ANNE|nr:DgyrCDS9961 [Dimorphilus gyrociliatus]
MAPGSSNDSARKAGDGCATSNGRDTENRAFSLAEDLKLTLENEEVGLRRKILNIMQPETRLFLQNWINEEKKELLSRTAAETHKLDLMAEISNLKLKLATSEKERRELNEQLKFVQSSSEETRAKLTQRLREVAELKARLAAYDASSLLSPHSSPDAEVDRLRRSVEQLLQSNAAKDRELEDLRRAFRSRRLPAENANNARLPPPGATSTPVQPLASTKLTTLRNGSTQPPAVLTESGILSPPSTIVCVSPSSSCNTVTKSSSFEQLTPDIESPTPPRRDYGTLPSTTTTTPSASLQLWRPVTSSLTRNHSRKMPPSNAYTTLSNFGKSLFRSKPSRWSSSAPSLARADTDDEALKDELAAEYRLIQQRQERQFNGGGSNGLDSNSHERKKKKTIKKIFQRLRRSSSQDLDLETTDEFKRNALRATAGPRLGWSRDDDLAFELWDSDRLAAWLHSLGLSQYVITCKRFGRTGEWLKNATPHDLEKELGMKHPLHRKKLLLAAVAASSPKGAEPPSIARFDHHCVSRWLDDIGLPQYKEAFSEARIDGRVLHQMTVDDLISVRVTSALHHASISRAIQLLRLNKFDTSYMIRRPGNGSQTGAERVMFWSNHRVMDWLRSIDLSEYTANLRGSGVHGALMVLEPRFTSEQLASILSIPQSKTLIRRHLNTHFITLVGNDVQMSKREAENQPGYVALSSSQKVRVKPKLVQLFSHKRSRSEQDPEELVCPLNKDFTPTSSIRNGSSNEIGTVSNDINALTNMLSKDKFLEDVLTSNV